MLSVRELMLLEEFENCLPEQTATYLNEQKVATLQQAAKLADEFTLTNKAVFGRLESLQSFATKPEVAVLSTLPVPSQTGHAITASRLVTSSQTVKPGNGNKGRVRNNKKGLG